MARMNPRRRRMAKALSILREAGIANGKAHDDSHKLQQGSVRSSWNALGAQCPQNVKSIAYRANVRPDGFAPSFYKDGARSVYQGNKR